MIFLFFLALSIYLGRKEYLTYGKLVPAAAITNDATFFRILPLFIQRFSSVWVFSALAEYFNNFNNFLFTLIGFLFLLCAGYFMLKAFFLVVPLFFRVLNAFFDGDNKPYK